jgi:hypothetical protein
MRWVVAIMLAACGGSTSPSSPGTGGTSQTLVVQPAGSQSLSISAAGGTVQLSAYQRENDGYGGTTLLPVAATWSSATTAVATVNQNGLVTAVASGSSVITATADTTHGTATVTVRP